jgi:hypothetical protein
MCWSKEGYSDGNGEAKDYLFGWAEKHYYAVGTRGVG